MVCSLAVLGIPLPLTQLALRPRLFGYYNEYVGNNIPFRFNEQSFPQVSIVHLGEDVTALICEYLDFGDLVRMERTCTTLLHYVRNREYAAVIQLR